MEAAKEEVCRGHSRKQLALAHTQPVAVNRVLKLKLQYFGHLMQRVDTLEKTLMLGEWKIPWMRV